MRRIRATNDATMLLAMLALGFGGATAGAQPSFPCGKAETATEKAICADERLARLDSAIAAAYRRLKKEMAFADAETLPKEQSAFLKARDACAADVPCLARVMDDWRSGLALQPNKGRNDSRERFVGRYETRTGRAIVRRTFAGGYHLIANQADPQARWVCDVAGDLQKPAGNKVHVTLGDDGSAAGADDKKPLELHLELRGTALLLREGDEPLAGHVCGHNGTIEGRYRRVTKLN